MKGYDYINLHTIESIQPIVLRQFIKAVNSSLMPHPKPLMQVRTEVDTAA